MAPALKQCWIWALVACSSGENPGRQAPEPPPPYTAQFPHQQAILDLGGISLGQGSEPLISEGTLDFTLDERYPLAGAKLLIHDLWYTAEVWLDEVFLGTVTGGSFPGEFELGDRLRPGPHRLGLRVYSPGKKSGLLLGARKEVGYLRASVGTLQLHLAPAVHIDWFALPFSQGKVQAQASVHEAPEGSRVRFEAALDGKVLQRLGEAPVVDGIAKAEPVHWEGELWSSKTGASALYQFTATLLDAQGEQLDRRSARSGLRETRQSEEAFSLNGEPTTFLAVRMEESWKTEGAQLNELLQAGVNSIEIHGSYPPPILLSLSDEAGIHMVVLPRCDGEARASLQELLDQKEKLHQQQQALAVATLHHPSLMFWSMEGGPELKQGLRSSFESDPLSRLVAGGNIPATSLSARKQNKLQNLEAGTWITEITKPPGIGPEAVLSLFREALQEGAIGGVLPINRNNPAMTQKWYRLLSELSGDLGTAPQALQRRRSMSQVSITGLTSEVPVWLEAPFAMPTGALPSSSGSVALAVFHAGPVNLIHGRQSTTIELLPDEREGMRMHDNMRRIQWPGL
jgi:hypothetical protein